MEGCGSGKLLERKGVEWKSEGVEGCGSGNCKVFKVFLTY